MKRVLIPTLFFSFLLWGAGLFAQDLAALARVVNSESSVKEGWRGRINLTLGLSQPVPYRVFTLAEPARLVFDFKEVDWRDFDQSVLNHPEVVGAVKFGLFQPGWSRLVIELRKPMAIEETVMETDDVSGQGKLSLVLQDTDMASFAKNIKSEDSPIWALPKAKEIATARTRQLGDRPLVVAIDAGHGGLDSGAEFQGFKEKDLVLQFALELQEELLLTGRYVAKLTREDDTFLSLPRRIAKARSLNADILISLHADAVLEGTASGTTVYTLSEKASNDSAKVLAAQLDRADLLAGVDLDYQDDELAGVLMDMARIETTVRSELLADMLVAGIAQSVGQIRRRPHLHAAFSVLRAPDIPSVLIELGFMNNRADLVNLVSVPWRKRVIDGIVLALDGWVVEDAAQAKLLRK